MMQRVIRHELDGSIRKDPGQGGRVSLEESSHTGVAIDVASSTEHARPMPGI
jgi:hypothetical protein